MSPLPGIIASTRGKLVTAAVVLLVIVAAIWYWRSRSDTAQFITEPVTQGAIRNVVNATGTVQAVLTVQVGSQVSGQIEALYADYNSQVKQGQVLAKLDPRTYQAALDGAQANLLSAQAKVTSSEADLNSQIANQASMQANVESAKVSRDNTAVILKRQDELREQGILSQNDYDTAKANADAALAKYNQAVAQNQQGEAQIKSSQAQVTQAKAMVSQAQAALKQSQVNLDYTTISSPVDGVVVSRSVDVGQTVAASLQAPVLFTIANDLSKMQVNASVDEADIGNIADVEDVQFTVDAYPNRNFIGRISEIRLEPTTVQNVTTYSVIINVDNGRLELKPGMTANISITVAKQDNVLRIPNAAMRYLPPGVTRDDVNAMLDKSGSGRNSTAETAPAKSSGSPEEIANAMPAPTSSDQEQVSSGGNTRRGTNGNGSVDPSADLQQNGGKSQGSQGTGGRGPGGRQGRGQGDAGSGQGRQGGSRGRGGQSASNASSDRAVPSQVTALAPGQMWNPAEKIQFPHQARRNSRPAIVWVLDANKKPAARHVVTGITDGKSTQVVSGDLKVGDSVVVGDSSQAAAAQNRPQQGGGFGGGFGGPGGRGGFGR